MVKIRLRRVGTKARPFYRVVVAPSMAGRNGRFVEVIGTYDPVAKPKLIKIDEARALHWLMQGAVPSETTAYLLKKSGVLEKFFEARPSAAKSYKFLDKTVKATGGSVLDVPAADEPVKVEPAKAEVVTEAEADAAPAEEVAEETQG